MGVSQREKIFFAEHLSLMIKGGITLTEALEILKEETKSRTFRRVLNDVLSRILEGESLEKGFARHSKIFDRFFLSVIRLGERSGTLDINLRYLSFQLRKDYEMRRKVVSALIYPAIVVVLAIVIAFAVSFFILPTIINTLQGLPSETDLPLVTKILISSTYFLKKYWFFILAGIIAIIPLLKIIQRVKFIKFYFDKTSLSLPFLGQIYKNINLARFSRNIFTLLKSGMPILEAMEICSNIIPNDVYRKSLVSVRSGIERGEKISSGLKGNPKNFPPVFSEMVLVGEKTGSLEESFRYLARFYEREVDSVLKNLSTSLEPILLILIGIFVAFIAIAIILPYYRLLGGIKTR